MWKSGSLVGVISSTTVVPSAWDDAVLMPEVDELNDSDEVTVDCEWRRLCWK